MKSLEDAKAIEHAFAEKIATLGIPRRMREKIAREALREGLGLWSDGFDSGVEAAIDSLKEWANMPEVPPTMLEALRICIQNLAHAQASTTGRTGVETIIRQIDERLS